MAIPDIGKDSATGRADWLNKPRERRPLRRRQLRRSRFVGLMKLVLPITALILVALLLAWPQLYRRYDSINFTFSRIQQSDGNLKMLNARYQGTDRNGRPFVVTADSAVQDLQDRRLVTLHNLQADMTLQSGAWVSLSASRGLYNEATHMLQLEENVSLFSDDGYEFHGQRALVDLNGGEVSSDEPVHGQGPYGLLEANRFWLLEKGNRIHFSDRVKVTLFPQGQG